MSFELVFKKISPKLKAITYKLNSRFTFFNGDDLFQEAATHLWQDFLAGKLIDKTDSYILQGCYFHLKNYIRCHRSKANLVSWEACNIGKDDEGLEQFFSLTRQAVADLKQALDNKLITETICNNGLTLREKEVVFCFMQGLTTRDIGSRLGISHVRVVKLTQKIRQKCFKYLDKN